MSDNIVGQIVCGYQVIKELASGGMGRALLAENGGRRVVLKECFGAGRPEDLHREAQFLARLPPHPHLPRVLKYEPAGVDQAYIVMEYVDGTPFQNFIDSEKQKAGWNEGSAYHNKVQVWAMQLAGTLDFLHTQRPYPILHRDIKPKNIMLRGNGSLALIDFGIAHHFDEEKYRRNEKDTLQLGTYGYVAPEYATFGKSTPRSDLYSMGMVMHFWLSGEAPDENGEKIQLLPPLPRRDNPLWDGLVGISERARHHEPAKRFDSAQEMVLALMKLTEDGSNQPKPCPVCAKMVGSAARFCPFCGAVVTPEAKPAGGARIELKVEFGQGHEQAVQDVLAAVARNAPAELRRFQIYHSLLQLEQDPGFGELVSLDRLQKVQKLPHQIEAARTALGQMRGYCLLADEVGLGKTIEAGIILSELMLRRLAVRILIVAPEDLCTQWQQEMFEKFDTYFLVFGRDVEYSLAWKCDRMIVPYRIIENRSHRLGAHANKYDLVIMDEAHRLIDDDPRRGWALKEFSRKLNPRYFLMLSATPLHNSLRELHTLLTLLKPGSVDDYERFAARYIDKRNPYQPKNVVELREKLQSVMIRNTRRSVQELRFPRRVARRVGVPVPPRYGRLFADFRAFVRGQLWSIVDRRRGGSDNGQSDQDREMNGAFRLALQELVESFHSSPEAFERNCEELVGRFRALLHARRDATLKDKLLGFKRFMTADLMAGKIDKVVDILNRYAGTGSGKGKFLVFSQYPDTAQLLYRELSARMRLPIVLYPVGNTSRADDGDEAVEALRTFYDSAAAMVCSENAAEGLNLQFANSMINFDLPWDPMKLEQRIGRIQRLGSVEPRVYIYNLFLEGTIEQDILEILDKKIHMFGATIGQVEDILGNLADDRTFDSQMLDLFIADPGDPDGIAAVERRLDDELNAGKKEKNVARRILAFMDSEGTEEGNAAGTETQIPADSRFHPTDLFGALGGAEGEADTFFCDQCRAVIPSDAQFCEQCGAPVVTAADDNVTTMPASPPASRTVSGADAAVPVIFCDECGNALPAGSRYCDVCRNAVAPSPIEEVSPPRMLPEDLAPIRERVSPATSGRLERESGIPRKSAPSQNRKGTYCDRCGNPVTSNDRFCDTCGEEVIT